MAWTYSGDPSASDKDAVRFLMQDTQTARQLLQDAEIEWLVSQEANVYMAAAACCDLLVIRAGSVRSKRISEFSITYDPSFYRVLAQQLRARGSSHQVPYAGGISAADKVAQQNDPDWVAPSIPRGLGDNPAAPDPSSPPVHTANPLTQI